MIKIDLLNPKSLDTFTKTFPGAATPYTGLIIVAINLGILVAVIGLIIVIPATALPSPLDVFFLQAQKAFLRLVTLLF